MKYSVEVETESYIYKQSTEFPKFNWEIKVKVQDENKLEENSDHQLLEERIINKNKTRPIKIKTNTENNKEVNDKDQKAINKNSSQNEEYPYHTDRMKENNTYHDLGLTNNNDNNKNKKLALGSENKWNGWNSASEIKGIKGNNVLETWVDHNIEDKESIIDHSNYYPKTVHCMLKESEYYIKSENEEVIEKRISNINEKFNIGRNTNEDQFEYTNIIYKEDDKSNKLEARKDSKATTVKKIKKRGTINKPANDVDTDDNNDDVKILDTNLEGNIGNKLNINKDNESQANKKRSMIGYTGMRRKISREGGYLVFERENRKHKLDPKDLNLLVELGY